MNAILQLVFSTFLFVQLGTAAFIPFPKRMNHGSPNRRTLSKQIFNNYVDEYEPQIKGEDLKSHTCAYYNYKEECHNSNDGCGVQTETCTHSTSNLGCYTMWNGNEITLQGCWAPSSRPECTPGECVSKQSFFLLKSLFHFCCCYGDKCNEKYGLSNHIPRWP